MQLGILEVNAVAKVKLLGGGRKVGKVLELATGGAVGKSAAFKVV